MIDESDRQLTYLSLFSGCGGFDIGFIENGYKCVGAFDIDPYVVDVHNKNLGISAYIHDLNDHNLPITMPNELDVVVAGSPCQGFSTIGKRKVNDPRNKLLLTGGEIAIKYNAKVFVCENVLGSDSGEHKKYWLKLEKLLQKNGYSTRMVKYNAADFGIPQTRKRIIFYAWKGNNNVNVELSLPYKNKKVLADVLSLDENVPNHDFDLIPIASNDYKIACAIKPGQKLCNVRGGERSVHTWHIPEVFGETTHEEKEFLLLLMKLRRQRRRRDFGDADPVDKDIIKELFGVNTKRIINQLINKKYIKEIGKKYIELTHTFNGKYKRLSNDTYSPTVDTRFGSYKNFLHPKENRSISVREAARIQGFRDSFVFYGPIKKQFEMIGNAVPPPLSFHIAKNIKEIIIPNLDE